jgi:hypothetical protein
MCGALFCSIKITEDVRRYAKENAIDESSAIQHGLRRKAEEFQHSGGKFILNHDEWKPSGVRRHRRSSPRGKGKVIGSSFVKRFIQLTRR